jgi:hypothetical protein
MANGKFVTDVLLEGAALDSRAARMNKDRRALLCAILAAVLAISLQVLIVRYDYNGNWTALYRTGAQSKAPPTALAQDHIYIFPNWEGYDGQMYHYMAHDPFITRGFSQEIDLPRFRYRRILVPVCAWLLAAGQDRFVDPAYVLVVNLFVFLGTWWVALIARHFGVHPAWSLAFLMLPAVLVSLDRMTVDIALVAVTAGAVYYVYRSNWIAVFTLCVLSGLIRESGLLIAAGVAGWFAFRRCFTRATIMAMSAIPAFGWYAYVNSRTAAVDVNHLSLVPFVGILNRLAAPLPYQYGTAMYVAVTALDYAALVGIVAAVFYCGLHARRFLREASGFIAFAFVVLVAVVSPSASDWGEAYGFARLHSPLILLVGMDGLRTRSQLAFLPLVLTAPRIGLRLGPQIVHALHALLGV